MLESGWPSAEGQRQILATLAQLRATADSFQRLAEQPPATGETDIAAHAAARLEQTRALGQRFSARMVAYLRERAAQARAEGLNWLADDWEADAAAIEAAAAWSEPSAP